MTQITENGFHRTRLDERLTQLQEAMKNIFGPDIDLSPESVDGQTLGIFAACIAQLDQLAEFVYQSFHPQTACGHALSRLVELNGMKRKLGAYSYVALNVTGIPATLIPKGSLVSKDNGADPFLTQNDMIIGPEGLAQGMARSLEMGLIQAQAGTLTKIGTPIYGWHTVSNVQEALSGRFEETDEELRMRRAQSVSLPSSSGTLEALYSGLLSLEGVSHVYIQENNEGHSVGGLPPHAIRVVIEGGEERSIAHIIWRKKNAGIKLVGQYVLSIFDTQGFAHLVRFDRPKLMSLYIKISIKTLPGFAPDGADRIRSALVYWGKINQRIGQDVIFSQLYIPINQVDHHSVLSVAIGVQPDQFCQKDISVPGDAMAIFLADNIHIELS